MLSLRLSPETDQRLSRLAIMTGRTKSYYVRELIDDHLEDLEDRYIAETRLEARQVPLTSKQMRERLGLDN